MAENKTNYYLHKIANSRGSVNNKKNKQKKFIPRNIIIKCLKIKDK